MEATRQKTNEDKCGFEDNRRTGGLLFFSGEVVYLFNFLRQGVSPWPRLASNSRQSSCLSSSPWAGDRCPPQDRLPRSPAAPTSPPLCPGAWLRDRGETLGERLGESVGPRLQRRHAPAPRYPPAPRAGGPAPAHRGPNVRRPPAGDEARGPTHSLTHSPWPRGRDALSRVAAFLCAAPRAARASHSPPPPRAARLPAPLGRAPRPARSGPFPPPRAARPRGKRDRGAPPEACARPRSAPDAAPPAGRAGMCKPG